MKIATLIARGLLGLVFVVFGLNGFLNFIPAPPMEGPAGEFVGSLHGSGYLYIIKALEIVGGILLLTGRLAPIGLFLLGPIVVNILLFHMFLAPEGLPVAATITLIQSFLIWRHWSHFAAIFKSA